MENRFIDQAVEVLGNEIADVISSEPDEKGRRKKVIGLLLSGAEKDLSIFIKTTEEERMVEVSMAIEAMNEIKRIRKEAGMTQKMFSDFFGIPVRTLQD